LKDVAQRLTDCIRSTDTIAHHSLEDSGVTIARQGGDEFTILLTEISHAPYAAMVAQRFLETLEKPFMIAGHDVFVSASIGVALYPADGEDLDGLLKNADIAMYEAKNREKQLSVLPAVHEHRGNRTAVHGGRSAEGSGSGRVCALLSAPDRYPHRRYHRDGGLVTLAASGQGNHPAG
jgi:GGDEF domain-containing protein